MTADNDREAMHILKTQYCMTPYSLTADLKNFGKSEAAISKELGSSTPKLVYTCGPKGTDQGTETFCTGIAHVSKREEGRVCGGQSMCRWEKTKRDHSRRILHHQHEN